MKNAIDAGIGIVRNLSWRIWALKIPGPAKPRFAANAKSVNDYLNRVVDSGMQYLQSGSDQIPEQTPPAVLQLQTIQFGSLNNEPLSAKTVQLTATSTSGLTVSLASNTEAVCTVSATKAF